MNNEILKKVAKLGVLARKNCITKLDYTLLLTDKRYANSLLSELEMCHDEQLLTLCLSLKVELGVLPSTLPPKTATPVLREQPRYLYSLRG